MIDENKLRELAQRHIDAEKLLPNTPVQRELIPVWRAAQKALLDIHNVLDGKALLSLLDELAALRAELERERLRLAACGVVAMSNTPESAARSREMHEDYRSASCDDVARAVDREMALRAENEAHRVAQAAVYLALGEGELDRDKWPGMIRALRTENEALRVDARRYGWLRERCREQYGLTIVEVKEFNLKPWCGDDPDRAIDAEMERG